MLITEMTKEECLDKLAHMRFGRLACARENQPYIVPIYFVYDETHLYLSGYEGSYLYSVATFGRKIEWMRANPIVCLEIDEVISHNDWMSIVVLGHYEELPDTPDFRSNVEHAHELLQRYPMWWQPAYVAGVHHDSAGPLTPIYYRIHIEEVTGRRTVPEEPEAATPKATRGPRRMTGWIRSLLKRAER